MTLGKNRQFLYLALPLLALAFIVLVSLSGRWLRGARIDLSENRLYTLSAGTQRILDKIDEPVKLKLYYSETAAQPYPQFRLYAQRVRELLEEMSARADGRLQLEVLDPLPFSTAEDEAVALGLTAIPLANRADPLYFGLVGNNSSDGQSTMPYIRPETEPFLEYDLAKLVSSLSADRRPVVALLGDLATGPGIDPLSRQPHLGWFADQQINAMFELRRLQANPGSIGDDVDLLMLVHPKQLGEDSLYAIDQFVLRGGRLLVLVDPLSEADPAGMVFTPGQAGQGVTSDLAPLFKAWGIRYDPGKVVLDSKHAWLMQIDANRPPARNPALIGLQRENVNQNDVVSAGLETVIVSSSGTLSTDDASPLRIEPLLQTSANAMLVDVERVREQGGDPESLLLGFKAAGEPFVVAARFTGPLKTLFPARATPGHLAGSRRDANIVVIADTDVMSDRLWVQSSSLLGEPVYTPIANNGDFIFNIVDNLVGNDDLIAVRSRGVSARPFIRVERLRRGAEQRYREKQAELEQQLETLQQRLNELQKTGGDGQPLALNRQQQTELNRFQADKLRIRKELRDVQRELNADIDALGGQVKLFNILGMPLLVVLLSLLLYLRRRWQRRFAGHAG